MTEIKDMWETIEQTSFDMEQEIAKAWETNRKLLILGYQSSRGSVTDYTVQMLGPDGYKNCLEESLEMIAKGELDLATEDGVLVGAQAAAALSASWSKSLNGLHKAREYKENLNTTELAEQGYTRNERDELVIKSLMTLTSDVVEAVDSKKSDNPLVRAKQELTKRTPLGGFMGQLNLSPDKARVVLASDEENTD